MNFLNKLKLPAINEHGKVKRKPFNYVPMAFFLPFFAMLAIMIVGQYEPFGNDRTMLYSDMYHQYYPFFVAFRKALLSGDSILYSWNVGIGMDYLGLISYYLASPLNLVAVLLPESMTLEYFSLLVPIKLGFAGLFMGIFLNKLFQKNDLSIPVFGAFYGLCAWGLAYQWNIMWLDSFALLPLVALGTVYLLRDKKFILYTLTLFLSIFANYYIGFFTCIFVLLLFFCYEFCRFPGFKRFAADFGRIALFSVLAIGMTAILELPAFAALQNTYSAVNQFPADFGMNIADSAMVQAAADAWNIFENSANSGSEVFTRFGHLMINDFGDFPALFDGVRQVVFYVCTLVSQLFTAIFKSIPPLFDGMRQAAGNIAGSHTHSFKEGLPNLYCGVGTMILAFLFLTAKPVQLRDKVCSLGLLLFFMISILSRKLDYIWHGFHFTNMIPYRFSFLFSFVMLYMAYRAWLLRDSFKLWQFIVAGVLALGVMMCSDKRFTFIFLSYNISLLLLFIGIFIYVLIDQRLDKKQSDEIGILALCKRDERRRKLSTFALIAVMGLELVLNMANFGVRFPYTNVTNYPRNNKGTSSAINYMYERENFSDFFRAEVTHAQTLNDGALNGYNGISTFTSSANVRVTEFMQALGYGARNSYNRYCFEEASPVSNLFLNLKYMIERDGDVEDNAYFDKIFNFDGAWLLENNAYLPMGFLAEKELADFNVEQSGNCFQIQNDLFKKATGISDDVWSILGGNQQTITAHGITLHKSSATGYSTYTAENAGSLRYTFQANREGFLCLFLHLGKNNDFRVYKNNVELYSENTSLPQMFAACDVQVGDTVMVEIYCKAGTTGSNLLGAGILNEEVFRKGYDVLAASTLDLTEFSNTKVAGTIHCNRDGLLYTSIPYDGNWSVTVDGEPAEAVLVGNCMMALKLNEGEHEIRFTYHNKAFTAGLLISVGCSAVFIGLIVLSQVKRVKKKKEQ